MFRRLRGMFGTALVWGGAWGITGAIVRISTMGGVLKHILDPHFTRPATRLVLRIAAQAGISCAITGALSGWAFAAALTALERRRNLHTISVARVTLWGALGSVGFWYGLRLIPMSLSQFMILRGHAFSMAVAGILGAVSAGGSVVLARRGMPLSGAPDAEGSTLRQKDEKSCALPPGPLAFDTTTRRVPTFTQIR